jgi:PTS system nitrogen regulatory IIA component
MEIIDFLAPEAVLSSLRTHSKKQLIHDLAARASQLTGLPAGRIFAALIERERLGSTGMGQGIAIPHGRVGGVSRIVGIFARLESPVSYDAIDEQPVDLVFLLLAPVEAGADHLKALARVSRLLRNQAVCEKLRAAKKPEVLFSLLTESLNGHGAQAA